MATMHRSKGLDFTAIAIVRVNDDAVPPKWLLNQVPDAAIKRSIVNAEKSLIHVAVTRAKKRLPEQQRTSQRTHQASGKRDPCVRRRSQFQ
jgi:superfamily I DNA/RNA helicase